MEIEIRIKGNNTEEDLAESGVGWRQGLQGETARGNPRWDTVPLATGNVVRVAI